MENNVVNPTITQKMASVDELKKVASGNRLLDPRTQPTVQECMKKKSRVTPTVTDGFF